jgi:hypothetical protein
MFLDRVFLDQGCRAGYQLDRGTGTPMSAILAA